MSAWHSTSSGVFVAQYHGECGTCGYDIERGQMVLHQGGELVHHDCATAQVAPAVVCPRCHLTSCDCEGTHD